MLLCDMIHSAVHFYDEQFVALVGELILLLHYCWTIMHQTLGYSYNGGCCTA